MSSASSPLDQETRRWLSPGEMEMSRGGSGLASAYLMFTAAEVMLGVPPKREGSWYCTQRTLVSGFAEVRLATSGSSQGVTPASAGSTICEAVTLNVCCCAAGVELRKVWSGGVVAASLVQVLEFLVPISSTRSLPVGVVCRSQLEASCSVLQLARPTSTSLALPLTVRVTAEAASGASAAARARDRRIARHSIARYRPAAWPTAAACHAAGALTKCQGGSGARRTACQHDRGREARRSAPRWWRRPCAGCR